jgi:3D (Asp-Asp-Asp) domain-containing protein
MVLKIKRAYPVTVSCDGKTKNVMTAYEKVKDILKEHNIILGKMDQIQPALNETVSRNGTIQIIRIKEKMISEKVPIPYESDIRYNDELEQGKIQLIQEGQNGEKEVQYKVVYKDGEEISKDIIKEEIITSAINEIVEKGTARYIATSRGNIRANKVLVMTATAYNSGYASTGKRPGHPYYGKTCIGTQAKPGVVAVDPRVIPLRTKLYIKSIDGSADYGFASAEDVGGAIKGNKIDLYFENPNDIRRFGRRKVEVYILE